jgi:uroporphyrinogen-III synthase
MRPAADSARIVALGPSTEKALTEEGLTVAAVCKKPNPEMLVKAVMRAAANSR